MYQKCIKIWNIFAGLIGLALLFFAIKQFILTPNLLVHPDNFINYEGGFIRRGLDGQLLYSLSRFFNINILTTISVYNVSTLILAIILIVVFKIKNKIPTYILLSMSILLLYLMYIDGGVRKDHVLFIFIFLQSSFFSKKLSFKSVGSKISFVLMNILGTLIHEVFFIITFLPVIIGFWIESKIHVNVNFAQRLFLVLPSTVLFILLLTVFVGNNEQADLIKHSYYNISYNLDYLNALFSKSFFFWNQNYNLKSIIIFLGTLFLHVLFIWISVYNQLEYSYRKFLFTILLLGQSMVLIFLCMISIDYARWVFLCFFSLIVFIYQYNLPKSKELNIVYLDWIGMKLRYIPFTLFFILTMPHSHWNGLDSLYKNNIFIQLKNKFSK